MAVLRVVQGPNPGKIYSLERDKMVLGRHPNCDIVLEVGAVSREHAQLIRSGDNYFLEDLKSRNGTFLNNEAVDGRRKLHEKDQIRICDLVFMFHLGSPEVTIDRPENLEQHGGRRRCRRREPGNETTITSKIDFSAGRTGLLLKVNAETKLAVWRSSRLGSRHRARRRAPKILDGLFTVFVQADRGFVVLKDKDRKADPAGDQAPPPTTKSNRISRTIINKVMHTRAILSDDTLDFGPRALSITRFTR